MGYQTQIVVSVIIISFSAIGGIVGAYMFRSALSERKTTIEHKEHVQTLRPDILIHLYPRPSEMLKLNNKDPLREYIFMIQNRNKSSVDITDCRITFFFPNVVAKVISRPLISSGDAASVSGVRIYAETKRGIRTYEEQPPNNPIANSFSLEAERANVNGVLTNTNIALFTCSKWPKNADFSGSLIVDQSKRPVLVKSADSIGTYSGTYNYMIDGKTYEKKLKGDIQPITIQPKRPE